MWARIELLRELTLQTATGKSFTITMDDDFDVAGIRGETAILFDHFSAQAYLGASVFWLRRIAALGGEQQTVEYWQIKRDGTRRGIVEVIDSDSQ